MDESPFRELPPSPPDPWLATWEEHRHRYRTSLGTRLGFFVLGATAVIFGVMATAGWPLFLGFVGPWIYYGRSPACPRCAARAYYWDGASQCVQCKLPFGTLKRDAGPPL